jgi:N-acetylmuramoyl-L-alanine amidase
MTFSYSHKVIYIFLFAFLAVQIPSQLGAQTGQTPPQAGKVFTIEETCRELGAQLRWDPFFRSGVFTVQEHRLAFYAGGAGEQGPVLLDGRELIPVSLPYTAENGSLLFPENFVIPVGRAIERYQEEERTRFRIAAVIIDPGHGGKDSGAVGTHTINGKTFKSVEKDIALGVSKGLYSLLTAAYPDKKVLLTRSNDTYLTLEERVSMANSVSLKENEAIIYISIHANASLSKSARGYEVWYLPPDYRRNLIDPEKYSDSPEIIPILNAMLEEEFTSESTRMARFILNHFTAALGPGIPSRGMKAENWYVVRKARMPSVLVELGFVTNPEDARLMSGEAHLKKLSDALYKGIADFINEFERSGGYSAPLNAGKGREDGELIAY